MAATSETAICNSALIKVGASRIIDLSDNSERAVLLQEQYHKLRDEVLAAHPWNFAIKRAELAPLVATPSFGFGYQFQLPSDCLRVLETDYPPEEWNIEGSLILLDFAEVSIKYISRITAVAEFSALFAETLACRIAAEICYSITQSTSLRDALDKDYRYKLSQARSFNGQESGGDRVYADEWLRSRY